MWNEEKSDDRSDARTGSFKSHSKDFSSDYDVGHYKSRRRQKQYLPVFVPEAEKKKSKHYTGIFPT